MPNEALTETKKRGLTGFALKWIAMLSMLIDHFGSIVMDGVIAPYQTGEYVYFTADMPFFVRSAPVVKNVCEALGSAAFPIFCFLIAEGFIHTRNRLRYGGLLLLFALISEIPYDLAHYQRLFDPSLQNVLFTLGVSVFTLYGISLAEKRSMKPRAALTALCIIAGCGLAFLIKSEYVFLGVSAISFLYLLRNTRWRVAGLAPLLVVSPWVLLALPPLILYNGERGRGSKYFFYIFYPAHFLLFAGIAYLLAIR